MERINNIDLLEYSEDENSNRAVKIYYYSGKLEEKFYEVDDYPKIELAGGSYNNKIINTVKLPERNELSKTGEIEFINCIFTEVCDWNFYAFNSSLLFKECIFLKDFTVFGYFNGTVSFNQSTFLGERASFQECNFEHFVFNLVTLNNCIADFQETTFYSNNLFFGNISLNNSQLLFNNSFFPKDAELLELLGTVTDKKSRILFKMIDLKFTEIRMFQADINRLEFIDCTFECNRFEFNFRCKTLIMQDCKNFRILTLNGLESMENLNIFNFVNTGRVLINCQPSYFITAINSGKKIIWKNGDEYHEPGYEEKRNQLFVLMGFYETSQLVYTREVQKEIDVIEKLEREKNESYDSIKIFLSYSWSDEKLANDIDDRFAKHGITLIRDKRDIYYKNSIKEFMKQIRQGDYTLIIISNKYLKSANCMYEVTEFIKDENYKERILPILRKDAKIFKAIDRTQYIRYWQDEYKKLKEESSDIDESNKINNIKEMIRLERIQRELPDFMSSISDMNLIVCDDCITDEDFEKIQILLFESL